MWLTKESKWRFLFKDELIFFIILNDIQCCKYRCINREWYLDGPGHKRTVHCSCTKLPNCISTWKLHRGQCSKRCNGWQSARERECAWHSSLCEFAKGYIDLLASGWMSQRGSLRLVASRCRLSFKTDLIFTKILSELDRKNKSFSVKVII